MNSTFFNISKEIANNFLQNIVLIDDKAYSEEAYSEETNSDRTKKKYHEFNAFQVSHAFAKSKKICAIYRPETAQDIDDLIEIAKKADITILDWQINLKKEPIPEGKEEEDVSEEDPRGVYTLKIISEIIGDQLHGKGSLKLIIIYTGETDLPGITDTIFKHLNTQQILALRKAECKIETDNIKILITAKSGNDVNGEEGPDNKFKHSQSLNSKIIRYEKLPEFILEEFTKMTTGLLSNFALKSLTVLRINSFKILNLFSSELDRAYLSHKSLLPNPDDAEELLLELMRDSIGDLLNYSEVSKTIDQRLIKAWLEKYIKPEDKLFYTSKAIALDNSKKYNRTNQLLEKLLISQITDVECRYEKIFKEIQSYKDLNKEEKVDFLKYLLKNNTSLFMNDEDGNHSSFDQKFANLSHHKNLFKPIPHPPKLFLGTIIKGVKTNNYWVCIQQKCDSVRLKKEEARKFIFLPLRALPTDDNSTSFHFLTQEGIKLQLLNKSFSVRTIKFKNNGEGVVIAESIDGKFIFKQFYDTDADENFEWIFDLKDLHAQRIANNYAAQLSRVGLDESEWLRRGSGI